MLNEKATTKATIPSDDFKAKKEQFLFDIQTIIEMEDIPNELVVNWDHTEINYVPVGNWTMVTEGLKRMGWVTKDSLLQYLQHHCRESFYCHK